ncbi:hypothetical protein [uncultured Brevundimonas sp.]|uniref:hypothetical protein n=1 Tax=uncultured Brevundimonas sp. TaxID=213418 RepID=UPI00261AAD89|nr:hypothetical protein [uncultured Brevundimonas sp.]
MLSRRHLFGAVPAAVAMASAPAVIAAPSPEAMMVKGFAAIWGKKGELAAQRAVEAGMRPEYLFATLYLDGRENQPRLNFQLPDKSMRTFGPDSEVL